MVPLKAVVTSQYVTGPDLITRFNNFPAVKITANGAPGYSSGQVISTLEEVAGEVMPSDYGVGWSGEAYEATAGGRHVAGSCSCSASIMVFLILAAQYEKWSLPVGVLMAVPFALFGALLAILLRGLENDVYFQIGLTMLVALAAKNAILIFEFAVLNREGGRVGVRLRRHGGDRAAAADRDDVARVHPRLRAACHRDGRVGEQPAFDRHGRDRRHARRDGDRGVLHPDVLLRARNDVGDERQQEDTRSERRSRGRRARRPSRSRARALRPLKPSARREDD